MNIVLKVAIAYLEAHPEAIEKLVEAFITAVVSHLNTQKAAA